MMIICPKYFTIVLKYRTLAKKTQINKILLQIFSPVHVKILKASFKTIRYGYSRTKDFDILGGVQESKGDESSLNKS